MPMQVSGAYADLYAWENLYLAYLRAAHGKRSQEAVARFERRLEPDVSSTPRPRCGQGS